MSGQQLILHPEARQIHGNPSNRLIQFSIALCNNFDTMVLDNLRHRQAKLLDDLDMASSFR